MKFVETLKKIPWWGWVLGLVMFGVQFALYGAAYPLTEILGTMDHAWCPKIPAIDDKVHLVPIFVTVYLYSYFFWICAPIAASLTKRSNMVNFVIGQTAAYLIGFIVFVMFPSYMDRTAEGLMAISADDGFFYGLLAWIYSSDGSAIALNLCPSFHCMISTYSYLAVRKQPEIHIGYRAYSLILAILVCLSTQFTKQHYLVDLVCGVSLAIICYVIVNKINPGKKFDKPERLEAVQ